jgi:DNA-binding PadR family transcriptional regulator
MTMVLFRSPIRRRELRSLEDAGRHLGLVPRPERPGRRVYEITPSGRESLDLAVTGVIGLQRLIAEFQARLQAMAPPRPLAAGGPRRRRSALRGGSGGPS